MDCGLIIHEAQLTYRPRRLSSRRRPGPLVQEHLRASVAAGGNVLLRSLDPEIKSECCRMMRESIQYALDNHAEALEYAMQFARDMEARLADKFVGMYVNHYTVDAGEVVPRAAQKLLDLGFEAGLIPHKVDSRICAVDSTSWDKS